MTVKQSRHPHVRLSQTIGTPGRARRAFALILWTEESTLTKIRHVDFNPPLAGRQGVAVLTSGRSSGRGGQAGHSPQRERAAPPTQRVPCDPQGACRPAEERAGVASRLGGDPPLRDRCPGQHQEWSSATPRSACHAMCAPSFSSWNFFQYGRLTAVRRPT
ncbi:mucin-associated surface protein (MASP) [Trypanosoma cruzi]|nr:mucin-associated surface protein (MASP) [Trypanosoma cruzi]